MLSRIRIVLLLTFVFVSFSVLGQQPNADALRWRYIGPVGNRVTSIVGVPGQPYIYYAGSASGGIFKTVDGGIHWDPIFDGQPVSSIGSLAIAASDPNTVWAGTGEAWIRSHISVGQGIYKSTDAGRTWKLMGLEKTGRIGHLAIDPKNPDIVMACAVGHAYGPQQERGVFRTTDGGKNWNRVLFTDENSGCSDLVMDPGDPKTLFAGMWPLAIHTWGRESGGPGSGLFVSHDEGATWTKITGHGLPTRTTGKWGLAIARSNPKRIYALIETGDGIPYNGQETDPGKLWRSDDGGENWKLVSYDRTMGGRTHYYFRVEVSPDNENEVHFLTNPYSLSTDGGQTRIGGGGPGGGGGGGGGGGFNASPGGDNHDIWIDPTQPNRMAVANDAGVSLSVTRGRSWQRIQLPNGQLYHVTTDNQIPYYVYGNRQDGPSYRGPSRTGAGGGFGGGGGGGGGGFGGPIPRSAWIGIAGGESGWSTPDPVDNNIIWSSASGSGSVGGIVEVFNLKTGQARNVEVWPDDPSGDVAKDLKYRFVWTMPLTISPHDHNKVYVGSQYVHQTTDGGNSWQVISPDLTLNDKSKQGFSGGLTGDNIGVEYAGVVFAIAESPKEAGTIWAGTNDGQVQITRNGGKVWTNVTKNIPNMLSWGTVSNIEPSRYNAGTAYITVDGHQENNRDPWIYRTADYGKTWKLITNGIPHSMLSYAHCVREDPVRQGLLYVGTENGIYVSYDDGENWEPLQNNLPHAPVYWITIQEHFNDLVISTYGRGFWIMDDITPIQQMTAEVRNSNAHLFPVHATYRFRGITVPYASADDPTAGVNPPYGAAINYYLKSAPSRDASIKILDAKGNTVQTLRGARNAGLNRVWWNLRTENSKEVRLRTAPLYAPDVKLNNEGWRPLPEGGRMTVLVPPGTYTVKLTVDGQDVGSQSLTLLKDPNDGATDSDIQKQTAMLFDLRKDLESAADMVNQIETIRAQLNKLRLDQAGNAEVITAAADFEKKLTEIEDGLIQRRYTGQGQDTTRFGAKLIGKMGYLGGGIANGDFPPNKQQQEVDAMFKAQLADLRKRFDGVMGTDLGNFNRMLKEKNIGNVIGAAP
jgi:photosystem II stability/assembly factor-like uncharacterized protein